MNWGLEPPIRFGPVTLREAHSHETKGDKECREHPEEGQ